MRFRTRFYTVLIVDDYEQFRRLIRLTLSQRTDFQIIGEASDGLEALQKAEQLQPDLVLLDIGLPTLSGIEVAKRIPRIAPKSKILVLSQESSPEVVEEAIRLGALGYVEKSRAQSELLPAIDAVLRGVQFVSSGLRVQTGIRSR